MANNQAIELRPIGVVGILALILLLVSPETKAQKYAYIDSEYVLSKIPAYKDAQKKLDDLSDKWQKQVDEMKSELQNKMDSYQEEKILLPEEMQEKKKKEIEDLKRQVLDFQKKKFGVNGQLFKERQELIKPIQDKIYKAIKAVSKNRYSFVFDKANQSNIMYADPKYDISDKVLREMGY